MKYRKKDIRIEHYIPPLHDNRCDDNFIRIKHIPTGLVTIGDKSNVPVKTNIKIAKDKLRNIIKYCDKYMAISLIRLLESITEDIGVPYYNKTYENILEYIGYRIQDLKDIMEE